MQVIPAIDLEGGRSRIVSWPGASTGVGAPTDRPDRIAERFAALGARVIHLVDFDGARSGAPANLEAVGAIATRIAVPLQLAGGLESAAAIRLAFAAGATRVVLTTAIADRRDDLRDCLAVAGDWLAVGLDPRPERLAAFPWRRSTPPTLDELIGELVGAGVARLVLSHGGAEPDLALTRRLVSSYD
ncbi:MAG TPA: HisA/HisF-related TIM barrel protein, partial [Candidatus Limnocylindrales bacterium]